MTITLELRPEEVALLQNRAYAENVDIETLLHRLIAQSASPSAPQVGGKPEFSEKKQSLAALGQAWRSHEDTDDPEEQAEREREIEELRANILRWRAEESPGILNS